MPDDQLSLGVSGDSGAVSPPQLKELLPALADARERFLTRLKGMLYLRPVNEKNVKSKNLRERYLANVGDKFVNIGDVSQYASLYFVYRWAELLPGDFSPQKPSEDSGKLFRNAVSDFLAEGFALGASLRPGTWMWRSEHPASNFDQYAHLAQIKAILDNDAQLRTTFSEQYLVKPDVVIFRKPLSANDLGGRTDHRVAAFSPLLEDAALSKGHPLLHASVSCKITMRSDRAQNTRTEALNLVRNRKGRVPSIVAVTAEPFPGRLASLALGTGDVDFVYHAALHELRSVVDASDSKDQIKTLNTLIEGRRLRDISDLALDLLI